MPPPRAQQSRRARTLALAIALQLGVGAGLVVLLEGRADAPGPAAGGAARQRAVLHQSAEPDPVSRRTAAVRELLDRRARAVRAHDRAGFLATVDPSGGPFRARQGRLVDALAGVPLAEWSYALDAARARPGDAALDQRYGTWWAPAVSLRYRFAHPGAEAATEAQHLTFVERSGRWYVGADDDFAASGGRTPRGLWDGGPVAVVRGRSALVLGRPGAEAVLRALATEVDAAVPRVTAVWGSGWSRSVVVVVPGDAEDLAEVVPGADLRQIAAVALSGPDRVVVNPAAFDRLGAVGRRVVLTHEVTHVATRAASGGQVPAWLVEGLADHVGYLGAGVPVRSAARELRADVRAGRVPTRLPSAADFAGGNPALPQAYEQAWLAVRLLVDRYGRDRVLALYRGLGRAANPAAAEQLVRRQLGMGTAELTARWRRDLVARLR